MASTQTQSYLRFLEAAEALLLLANLMTKMEMQPKFKPIR
jgi:hypothetical protein